MTARSKRTAEERRAAARERKRRHLENAVKGRATYRVILPIDDLEEMLRAERLVPAHADGHDALQAGLQRRVELWLSELSRTRSVALRANSASCDSQHGESHGVRPSSLRNGNHQDRA